MKEYLLQVTAFSVSQVAWEYRVSYSSDKLALDYAARVWLNCPLNKHATLVVWAMPEQRRLGEIALELPATRIMP